MQILFILLAILVGQYIHIYFKWVEFKNNQVDEPEDNFLYYFKSQLTLILTRMVIFFGLALWIALTTIQQYFQETFQYFVWPFYAWIGYSLDSFIRNMFTNFQSKKITG